MEQVFFFFRHFSVYGFCAYFHSSVQKTFVVFLRYFFFDLLAEFTKNFIPTAKPGTPHYFISVFYLVCLNHGAVWRGRSL